MTRLVIRRRILGGGDLAGGIEKDYLENNVFVSVTERIFMAQGWGFEGRFPKIITNPLEARKSKSVLLSIGLYSKCFPIFGRHVLSKLECAVRARKERVCNAGDLAGAVFLQGILQVLGNTSDKAPSARKDDIVLYLHLEFGIKPGDHLGRGLDE